MSSYISVSLCLCVLSLMRPSGIARLHAHPPQQPANMLSPFRTTRFNFFCHLGTSLARSSIKIGKTTSEAYSIFGTNQVPILIFR